MRTREPTAKPPHHPRPRYRPGGKITRDLVLATELEIIDRDGAEALSMRRLAAALIRDLMIIYQHAPTRWSCSTASPRPSWPSSRSTPPTPTGPPSCAPSPATTARLALARPHVVPLLVTRPLATALGLRPCGRSKTSSRLTRAGFSGPDVLHFYRALFGFLHGHVLNELQDWSAIPTRPTACTGSRSPSSRCCADSPPSCPPTTEPPNSNAASTSSSPAWPPQ